MTKILTVVGARPQFVKAAALSRALRQHGGFREILVHTGQHYDTSMSEVFFREMEIPEPDYNLQVSNLPPTDDAVHNLEREGFRDFPCHVFRSGDVMQDAALYYAEKSAAMSRILRDNGLDDFVLCTLHRAENTDDPTRLQSIVEALNRLNRQHRVFLPLHPRTRRLMETTGIRLEFETHPPVGYFDMLELLKHCRLVVTDSGGLQKEAYFFKKHCVTLREETEWNELVRHGVNVLAGSATESILEAADRLLKAGSDFSKDFYGNGHACRRIVRELEVYLSRGNVHG